MDIPVSGQSMSRIQDHEQLSGLVGGRHSRLSLSTFPRRRMSSYFDLKK